MFFYSLDGFKNKNKQNKLYQPFSFLLLNLYFPVVHPVVNTLYITFTLLFMLLIVLLLNYFLIIVYIS